MIDAWPPIVGFINSQLTAEKHIPVNPKAITGPPNMSLLHEAKSMPALIINQCLSLLHTRMTLVGTKRPTSSSKCSFKTSTGLSAEQMLRQGEFCIAPQIVFQMFEENLPSY